MLLSDLIPEQQSNYLEEKANSILKDNHIKHPFEIDIETIIDINYRNIRVIYTNQDSKAVIKRNTPQRISKKITSCHKAMMMTNQSRNRKKRMRKTIRQEILITNENPLSKNYMWTSILPTLLI